MSDSDYPQLSVLAQNETMHNLVGVSACVTTGIYCRPDCTAKPNPHNVLEFSSAAAAEASHYRACLRCRPYRTERNVPWTGPEVVCQAVTLIAAGVLDDKTDGELAHQLGVSDRHLRRLFIQHLSITPDQLARSRRAHFARRLLDDTELNIAEIAFASGFGSVRQLNRVLTETFKATPTELRAKRRRSDLLVADGGLAIRLPHTTNFSFAEKLRHLEIEAIPGVESILGNVYRRTILHKGHPGVVEVRQQTSTELRLTLHLSSLGELTHIADRIRRLLGVDSMPEPWSAAEELFRCDSRLEHDPERQKQAVAVFLAEHATPITGLQPWSLSHVIN